MPFSSISMFIELAQADPSGLSLNQILLIIAAIVFILDFFFNTDALTHIAYVLVCIVVARFVPFHPLIRVLIGILAWFGIVFLHYKYWREFVEHFANRVVAPDKYRGDPGGRGSLEGLIGKPGVVRKIEGSLMIEVQGDLWNFEGGADLSDGDHIKIISVEASLLRVEHAGGGGGG